VRGGRSGHVVSGGGTFAAITGIGAAVLLIAAGSLASSSPPLGVDVTGTAAATLSMSGAGQGAFVQAVTGTAAGTIDALAGSAAGDVLAPVTGTGAGTLGIFSNTGIGSGNYPTGTADATLVVDAAGVGQHIAPIVGAGASTLAITGAGAGRADQLVAGAATGLFALTAAASGTASGGASDPVPAAIATPVVGTDLTAVWNLQTAGATGPRYAYTNGTWTGSIDAYLTSVGISAGNDGALWWNVGTSTKTLEKYNFTGAPALHIGGTTGTANVLDCTFTGSPSVGGMTYPTDINGGIDLSTGLFTVNMTHVTFDGCTFYQGSGFLTWSYCRFKNQLQGLGDSGFSSPGVAVMTYDHCYITGGGVQPASLAHVELTQMVRSAAGCSFHILDTLVDVSRDGQTTNAPWGSGWTGMWSIGLMPQEYRRSIFLGLPAIDANPANPNVSNNIVAYGTGATPVVTDCVMEPGQYGYTRNLTPGPAYSGINGGGNRSFANVALVTADFG